MGCGTQAHIKNLQQHKGRKKPTVEDVSESDNEEYSPPSQKQLEEGFSLYILADLKKEFYEKYNKDIVAVVVHLKQNLGAKFWNFFFRT